MAVKKKGKLGAAGKAPASGPGAGSGGSRRDGNLLYTANQVWAAGLGALSPPGFEDKDLCKRINVSGWQIMYYPLTSMIHLLAGSSGNVDKQKIKELYHTSQLYYYRKHLGRLQNAMVGWYLRITGKLQCR